MNTLSLAFESAWKVLLVAIVLGAGVPALFAFGVRGFAAGEGALTTGESAKSWGKPVGLLCFALVAVAVALGLAITGVAASRCWSCGVNPPPAPAAVTRR